MSGRQAKRRRQSTKDVPLMEEPWGSILDGVMENDASWFREHPEERFRHRDAIPGEWTTGRITKGMQFTDADVYASLPSPPAGWHWERQTEVEQIAKGVRMRRPWGALVQNALP